MARPAAAVPGLLAPRVLLENLEAREQPAGDGAAGRGQTRALFFPVLSAVGQTRACEAAGEGKTPQGFGVRPFLFAHLPLLRPCLSGCVQDRRGGC